MNALDNIYKINKSIPVPLYYQLKESIIDNINNSNLNPGDTIPTELEFCNLLGISRPTVNQAIKELINEGYLKRIKGKGTFISEPKIDGMFFSKLQSFNDEMIEKQLTPSTKVLSLKVIDTPKFVYPNLDMNENEKCIYLKRIRYASNQPVVYVETYLPYNKFSLLIDQDFSNESLYSLLSKLYNVNIFKVDRTIKAINCSLEDSKLLSINENDAICLVNTVGYDNDNSKIEYSIARYCGFSNQFSITLYNN
ncbi:MAG: GntR family transcriptional regulator [Peptostreptococcaceae bacterium]